MGAVARRRARRPRAAGVEIETDAPVREVLLEKDRAGGVVLADGRVIRPGSSRNVDPKLLYTQMVAGRGPAGRPLSGA